MRRSMVLGRIFQQRVGTLMNVHKLKSREGHIPPSCVAITAGGIELIRTREASSQDFMCWLHIEWCGLAGYLSLMDVLRVLGQGV